MNQQVQQNPQQSYYSPAAQTRSAQSTMQNLEQTLNAVDTNAAWSHTPVSGTATPQQQQMQQRPSLRSAASVPVHGAYTNNMQGMFPGVSRKEMMRVFMEGGSPQTGGGGWGGGGASAPAANSSANTSNAYNNYRTAVNEEAKSRNYANTARYDGSQWNRKNAASQAEYAANNANYAAQRAESAAYSGDSQARGYANLARQAANRARENANRARYNADTIR